MNPENEVKKANLDQDNIVTEQLPEQDFNQNTAELDSPAPDEAPVAAEQHSESETKTTQTIPADSAQPASSEPIVPPEGALPQMSVPAAPQTQGSFQPAAYARETDVKPGKFASFCKKTWVKVVPIVGAVIIFFMAGLGAGMAISHHGGEGHTPPGHGAQMAPGGRMGAGKVPGGKMGPGANQSDQMQPDMNQQPGQMAPGGGNQNPSQGQNQQQLQGNQNQNQQQDKQGTNSSQNSNGGTTDSQNKSAAPSNNS